MKYLKSYEIISQEIYDITEIFYFMKWQKGHKRVVAEADESIQKWRCRC